MGSLKSRCTTSCRSSIETMALNCLVFEKIAFLYFGDRQCWRDSFSWYNQQRRNFSLYTIENMLPNDIKRFDVRWTSWSRLDCSLARSFVPRPVEYVVVAGSHHLFIFFIPFSFTFSKAWSVCLLFSLTTSCKIIIMRWTWLTSSRDRFQRIGWMSCGLIHRGFDCEISSRVISFTGKCGQTRPSWAWRFFLVMA